MRTSKSRTILITGASSGIGLKTARHLLERGHTVIVGVRGGEPRARELFLGLPAEQLAKLHAVDLHLDQMATFERAVRGVDEKLGGRLDCLINNAGYGLLGDHQDQTPEQLRHQMEVNFLGPVELTRVLLPALKKARGKVINVTSLMGLMSFPFYGAYCASKFALEAHTEALWHELRPWGVQVALLEPGAFQSDFAKSGVRYGELARDPASPGHARMRAIEAFAGGLTSATAADPKWVARAIRRLVEKKRIPLRTRVGLDSRALYGIKRIFPEALVRWVIALVFYVQVDRRAKPRPKSLS